MTQEEIQKVKTAIALLNSMVYGGEQHSETSLVVVREAFVILDNVTPSPLP